MSLCIDTDEVVAVLLSDGWHEVIDQSFDLDAYEFEWEGRCIHGGGNSEVCATGFGFKTTGAQRMYGPLTAILAVRTN